MYTDAPDQVLRLSLEGAEFALKISGAAAKNIVAALYAVLKDQRRTKGKARITTMLRQQRPMTIYTIKKEDCSEFAKQAKEYGVLYAPIPVKKGDDTLDILVFQDDAARVNRIVERLELTVLDTASIENDIQQSREDQAPFPGRTESPSLSGSISAPSRNSERDSSERPSVRRELKKFKMSGHPKEIELENTRRGTLDEASKEDAFLGVRFGNLSRCMACSAPSALSVRRPCRNHPSPAWGNEPPIQNHLV